MKKLVLAFTLLLTTVAIANAAPVTFFGQDAGNGDGVAVITSWNNSNTARNNFFSNLINVGTETFESFSNLQTSPFNVNFGATGTATLGAGGTILATSSSTTGVGRFAISGTNYFDTTSAFALTFDKDQSAFGFYGIDIGDFNGQLSLTYSLDGTNIQTLTIPHTVSGLGGSVLYYGFYDIDKSFDKIVFSTTAGGTDYFGFDNFSIGTREQINPPNAVPEPATMSLLGFGLLGILGLRRKK